jgi:hypothetical protein
VRTAARSTRVLGIVVTGIPLRVLASTCFERRVATPGTARSVRVVTSGAGAVPRISMWRKAAALPLSSAPSPQALTAAR